VATWHKQYGYLSLSKYGSWSYFIRFLFSAFHFIYSARISLSSFQSS
jgi:hypothetical protein